MLNPSPPAPGARAPRLLRWIVVLALAGYAVFLARNFTGVAGGADSSGYLNSARLFAAGQLTADMRAPPELRALRGEFFQPLGFTANENTRRLVPTYPTGLPLHLAAAAKVLGWELAPWVVEIGAAVAALLLCYLVARNLGLDAWLATTAAVSLGAFPVFVFSSIQPLSDTLATMWCLAAVWAATRATPPRSRPAWAALAGFAFAMAVLVRATNILLAPALILLMGLDWKRLVPWVLGGLPGAAWLAYYNHTLYGGAFRSGYGKIEDAFALQYAGITVAHFAGWLALLLPAVLLVLPLVGLWRGPRRPTVALLMWFGALAGLYSFYEISHQVWWCLRFILPGVPGLILAGVLGLSTFPPRVRRASAIVICAWAVGLAGFWPPRLHVHLIKGYEEPYRGASLQAAALVPPHALVAACAPSGALFFYTELALLRWDLMPKDQFATAAIAAAKANRPVYALLFEEAEGRAFREHLPGQWARVATYGNSVALWQLVDPALTHPP